MKLAPLCFNDFAKPLWPNDMPLNTAWPNRVPYKWHIIFPILPGRIFHPLSKNLLFKLILRTRSGGFLLLPARCVYGLPARYARCLNQRWPFARDWRCQLSLVLAKRRSTLRAGTESPGVPVAGNQSARSKRLAIQDRMISKSSNKPTEPKAKQTN